MSTRLALPSCRNHITQKVRIADQRTLYISVHDDPTPAEIFLRVKGADCTPETIALYDVIARLMSVYLQYGASLDKLGDLLTSAKFTPCGPVVGHDHLKHCSSLPDLIGRHLLVEYCGRDDLAHVTRAIAERSGESRS
jgi:ribonucleoside-diphosphate reductase alpha chain